MSWLRWSELMAGKVISWPVLVLVVLLIFHRPLVKLIGRIKSYEGMGQKLEFAESLAEAEKKIDALPKPEPTSELPEPRPTDAIASGGVASKWKWENKPGGSEADWSVPAFIDTELGCQLTELPIS